jgi:hypothetical protein
MSQNGPRNAKNNHEVIIYQFSPVKPGGYFSPDN